MLDHEARTASVIAEEPTWCLVVDVTFIKQLPTDERNTCYLVLYSFFSRIVTERLMTTTEELAQVQQELAAARQQLAALKKNGSVGATGRSPVHHRSVAPTHPAPLDTTPVRPTDSEINAPPD